jgi:mannitol-specific phosphotransferase system IIBC component
MQKVTIGSLSIFAYAITTMFVFPEFGFIIGTLFAYAVSLVVTLLLMKFQSKPKEILRPSL